MNADTNRATEIATELVREAQDHLEALGLEGFPNWSRSDGLPALAITPTIGARVLLTHGGPTVEMVLETTHDREGKIVETTGRIEWSHGDQTAAHTLTAEQASDLWYAYALEVIVAGDR